MSLHTRNFSSREHLAFHHINSEMGRDGTCCRLYYKSRMGAVKHDIFPFQVVFCKLRRDFQKAHLHHGEGRQRHIRLWLSMCWCLDREKRWTRTSEENPKDISSTLYWKKHPLSAKTMSYLSLVCSEALSVATQKFYDFLSNSKQLM